MSSYTYYTIFYSLFPIKLKKKKKKSPLSPNLYYFIGLYVKIKTGMLGEL